MKTAPLLALALLAGCVARPKPLITGGTGGVSLERAIEQSNIEDLDAPPPEGLPEQDPAGNTPEIPPESPSETPAMPPSSVR